MKKIIKTKAPVNRGAKTGVKTITLKKVKLKALGDKVLEETTARFSIWPGYSGCSVGSCYCTPSAGCTQTCNYPPRR